MSRIIRDAEGNIKKLRLTDVIVSYPYLVTARPEGQFKAGSWGAEFIIRDKETIDLVKAYAKEVAQSAIATHWNNRTPNDLTLPYRGPKEDNQHEEGAFIVKAGSPKFQPSLFIREANGRARLLEEDEHDEFYAGMVADADITIKPYNVNGKAGITAYLGAVCKVGEGEPFSAGVSLEESFSLDDIEDDDEGFDVVPEKKAPTKKGIPSKETNNKPAVSLDDLLGDTPSPKKASTKATPPKDTEKQITLDDLLQ